MAGPLQLFPAGTTVDDDGVLRLGGVRVTDLAREVGTPALVVDEAALRARAREYAAELTSRWSHGRVVFASKAFPATAIQRIMVEEGLGLDVAGGGELLGAIKAGVDPALVVLHGNAKSDEEIAMAVAHDIGLVVVDNGDDVDRLEAAIPSGRHQDVLVRVIPGVTADTHASVLTGHEGSKFGLSPDRAREVIARITASPRLRMRGVHAHVGSQILQAEPLAAAVEPLAALGEFDVYDLGGGLGARYSYADQPPTVGAYLDFLVAAARAHLPAGAEIIIEPGRSMVASSAATLYRVLTVKRGATTFVAVDGGMGDNLEVALFHQRFEAVLADRMTEPPTERAVVVGRHCESGDVLVDGVDLPSARVGDLLAVPATGAYCFTMANNYNGNRRLPVVLVRDGEARVVVRRETWADLLARNVPLVAPVGDLVLTRVHDVATRLEAAAVGLRAGTDGSLHAVRVEVRRLRSILSAYRAVLGARSTRRIARELRWLGRELSAARDAEVLRERFDELLRGDPELATACVGFGGHLDVTSAAALARARAAVRGDRYRGLRTDLDALNRAGDSAAAADQAAKPVLKSLISDQVAVLQKATVAALARTQGADRDRALHTVRKKAKRLRHTAESAVPVLGGRARRLARGTRRLQEILGRQHDCVLSAQALTEFAHQQGVGGAERQALAMMAAVERGRAADAEARFARAWEALQVRELDRWGRHHSRHGGR